MKVPDGSRRIHANAVTRRQTVVVTLSAEVGSRTVGSGLSRARSAPTAPMTAEGLYLDADWLRVSPLMGCTGLRLTGEADMHTAEILSRALRELPPDVREIHLQLASLEFIDVAAARHLAALAERPARPTVILHYSPPSLIFLLGLLWPGSLDRCRICGKRADPKPHPVRLRLGHRPGKLPTTQLTDGASPASQQSTSSGADLSSIS